MAISNPGKRFVRWAPSIGGPKLAFAAAMLAAGAALALSGPRLPGDLVLPVLSMVFFALAASVALIAGLFARGDAQRAPSYWDVAGALTFIGICVAALVDPDQMVRLVEGANRAK